MNSKQIVEYFHMATGVALSAFALTSCGTFTRVSPDGTATVQAGVLSSIQSVIVQVKPGRNGTAPTITIAQTGYDGTSVANNGIAAVPLVATAKYAFKSLQSNNLKDTKIESIKSKTTLGQQKLANDAADTAGKQAIAKQAQANGLTLPAKP